MKDETIQLGLCIVAVQAGNVEAQYALAQAYENGDLGLEENEDTAYSWCLESADNGYIEAMYKITEAYYYEHLGLEEEAFEWYLKAANHGHVEAMYEVAGKYYDQGRELEDEEDYEWYLDEAYKWCSNVAENGHQYVKQMLARFS